MLLQYDRLLPSRSVLRDGEKLGDKGNVIGSGPGTVFLVTWNSATNLTVECSWDSNDQTSVPPDKTIAGVAVHFISRAVRDAAFLTNRCIPMTRSFVRTNGIAFDPDFDMSAVHRRSAYLDPDTRAHSLGITLGKRFDIDFVDYSGTNYVEAFVDRKGMEQAFSPAGKAAALAQTNLIPQSVALSLATATFHRAGHSEEDFHPVQIRQWETQPYLNEPIELLPGYVVT